MLNAKMNYENSNFMSNFAKSSWNDNFHGNHMPP